MPPWSFLLEVQRCQSGVSGVQSWGRGQLWEPWADRVCAHRAGIDPVSGGNIWKQIYQPSYIQEQYVLTHCSVSTDRSQGAALPQLHQQRVHWFPGCGPREWLLSPWC